MMEAKIYEAGNGWPEAGDYVRHDGELYVVERIASAIHTSPRGNYVYAQLTESSWDGDTETAQCDVEAV